MTEAFESLRSRLFAVAYDIVGGVADAEDVVQDTWIAWSGVDHETVRDPEAYLVRMVTNRSRYDSDPAAQRRLGSVFVDAIRTGDLGVVMSVIAPDVVLITDGGGHVQAALRPIRGADNVLRFFAGLALRYPDWTAREATLNGLPALLVTTGDTISAIHLGVVDGIVTDVWVVRNPEKLTELR